MPPDSSQQQIAIEYHQSNQSSGQSNEGGASSGVGTELDDVVVIAQNTAVSTSTDTGRVENLRLATQAIDGIVIEPGETFSFNEVVGDVENDSRYRPAPMVLDSETDYIRGGGVSQVSSALYVAALSTNLVIEERHPHPTNVDFAQTGLDANVKYSRMDLRLSNHGDSPIKINAVSEGQTITVTLLGQPLADGIRIEPMAVLIIYHMAGAPLPDGLDVDSSLRNSSFYIIESFKVFYYHGNMTESVLLARDTYMVLSGTVVVMPDGTRAITQ